MKISPCPFCGSSDVDVRHDDCCLRPYCVECVGCFAIGSARKTEDQAIESWNTRTGTDLSSVHAEIIARLNLLEQMLCKDDAKDAAGINTHLRNVWWFRDSINEYFASRSGQSSATPPTAPCPPPSEAP
jgi:Lar family restriction alleviation protein